VEGTCAARRGRARRDPRSREPRLTLDSQHTDDPGKEERAAQGIPVVPALDGLRGLAVFMIVAWHVWNLTGNSSSDTLGRLVAGIVPHGIQLLFLISGFVMFLPTAARGRFGSVRAYALRRVARIVPAFYLSLAIVLLFWSEFVAPGEPIEYPGPLAVLAQLTFVSQPLTLIDEVTFAPGFGVNLPLWTLSVEAFFYLTLPFVAVRFRRNPIWGLLIALAISIGWRLAFPGEGNQLPYWIGALAAGMAAAQAYVRLIALQPAERVRRLALPVQLLALTALAVLGWVQGGQEVVGGRAAFEASTQSIPLSTVFPLLLGVLVVATALGPSWASWLVTNRAARWVGDRSYGVYVAHALVFRYIALHFARPDRTAGLPEFAKWFVLVGGISMVYGWASFRFVELPVRRWARRVAKGWRTSSPAPAVAEARRP
jgi:peptidoglycan/LPS O-acetylase OafA/YrhL